jgi:hypothetical protein
MLFRVAPNAPRHQCGGERRPGHRQKIAYHRKSPPIRSSNESKMWAAAPRADAVTADHHRLIVRVRPRIRLISRSWVSLIMWTGGATTPSSTAGTSDPPQVSKSASGADAGSRRAGCSRGFCIGDTQPLASHTRLEALADSRGGLRRSA